MKYRHALRMGIVVMALHSTLVASSITAYDNQTAYKTTNHVFSHNDIAQGFVRLNDGFTVMPHSCVTMDTVFTVSGGIDLRETSTIRMLKDLEFDSGVTLTTGGNIDGRGHTLILNGDFRIPAGKVLHFNGDTIINACGHEIVIGENAEMFVDTNVTLTIANAVLKTTRNAPTYPALRCGALTSKLALDNVTFAPVGDFLFEKGQLFVHNDVLVTGTSAFVYNSPVPSFITKNSCLYLDHAVTFSMAPATFTDAPFTLKNTYTDNNFIRMADETSVLYLNGCALQTTNTGWRLTTGTVSIDDRVQVKTDPTLTMTALEPLISNMEYISVDSLAWHPSGNYLAVGGWDGLGIIKVYHFDGSLLMPVASYIDDVGWQRMQWSPDGRYLIVGSRVDYGLYGFEVFSFDGVSLTLLIDRKHEDTGGAPCWSPDGKYLAFTANASSLLLQVYRFDGSSLIYSAQINVPSTFFLQWSKDGRHIITGGGGGLLVYDFDGTALTLCASDNQVIGTYDYIQVLSLSPDGRYIGATIYNSNQPDQVAVYRFDGNSLVLNDLISVGGYWSTCDWSLDGRYFAVGVSNVLVSEPPSHTEVYSFDGKTLTLIPGSVMDMPSFSSFYMLRFSPNGKYLAQGGSVDSVGFSANNLRIYAADYTQTTTPQTLATSMVFGDSVKGSAYDAHLRLQPGASLNLTGKMLYDNVN